MAAVLTGLVLVPASHPVSTRVLAAQVPVSQPRMANAHLQREVFGFVSAGVLGDPNVGYPSWQLSLLSTVAFFALHVNSGDGNLVTNDTGWNVYHSSTMTNFVRTAHANGVRVIVSVNLHDFGTSPTNQVCQGLTPANAQNTISQIVAQVAAAGIDGVNMDYEGTNVICANGQTSRDGMTDFLKNLRAAMPRTYIAIDTYSGSAEDNLEFFNITGLDPYVDSFFVMAYDMDFANWPEVPLNCTSYCFNPVSPLNTYRFNTTKSMQQYTALVPATKVILGQPYYGTKGCVANPDAVHPYIDTHQYPTVSPYFLSTTYIYASTAASDPAVSSFRRHRDPGDGVSAYDTWWDRDFGCWRMQYWDDVVSLGAKYDLINHFNLRGVGLFELDYAGGAPEVWNVLATHFTLIPGLAGNVNACAGTTSISVSWTAAPTAGGPVTSYQVSASPGNVVVTVPGDTTFATLTGLTGGTSYTVTVRGINSSGEGLGVTTDSITPLAVAPASTSYFSWFDNATPGMTGDNIHVMNNGSRTSTGCITVTGKAVLPFTLPAGGDQHVTFPPSTIGGPVVVTVNSGPAVLASQRVQYFQSFNELWASPASQAAAVSYINWFDKASPGMVGDNIHVLNTSASTATVTVSLAGAPTQNLSLAPGVEGYATFPNGVIGGPVTINSNVPVLASQRVQYYQTFNEVVARSAAQATPTSYFNWFDKATVGMIGDNIHILNTSGTVANGIVSLPGAANLPFSAAAGQEIYVSWPAGTIGGPVTVSSNVPVLATQRVQYFLSFNEVASESTAQAALVSHLMWFDKATVGMNGDNIHILNTSASTASGFARMPGAPDLQFTLAAGQEIYLSWPAGVIGGPVTVSANQPVLAAQRVQYFQSFNEVPAL